MGDHHTVPLQYGHLGDIKYLPDEQTWEFSRRIDRRPYLTPFNDHNEIFSSIEKEQVQHAIELPTSFRLSADKENALCKNCPQLAPGLELLRDLNASSSVLEHITAKWDPQVSTLLSVGNTVTNYSSKSLHVAGFVPSTFSNVVQIVSPRMRSIEWRGRRINIPVMAGGDKALFTENRGRIYQVAFAESVDEKSTFMAVRYAKSTAIFRPVRHTKSVAHSYIEEDEGSGLDSEPTRLDANPIVEIPISSTGEAPHADVCFNPWYQKEIAVIDTLGNWNVWEISSWKSYHNIWRGRCTRSGSINLNGPTEPSSAHSAKIHDGWTRIMWLGNVHSLIAFERRRMVVITLAQEVQYQTVNLKFFREAEWIVDVLRSRSNTCEVFVLTTLRIIWLSLITDDFSASQTPDTPRVKVLLEWYHYRDAEDVSLRLAPLQIGPEFSLVLYSQWNTFAQIFRFAHSSNDDPIPVSVSDPSTLHLPAMGVDSKCQGGGSGNSTYSALIFQEINGTDFDDTMDESGSLRLIKLLAQRTDNSLVESLYIARKTRDENVSEYDLFRQSGQIRDDRYPLSAIDLGRSFIVEDWYEQPVPLTRQRVGSTSRRKEKISFPLIVDLSRLYAFLLRDVLIPGSEDKRILFGDVITLCGHSDSLKASFTDETTALTLHDLFGNTQFRLDDIEMGAEAFEALLSRVEDIGVALGLHPDIVHLPLPYNWRSSFASRIDGNPGFKLMYEIYDNFVQDQISPLPQILPVHNRISKERLIRIAMIELSLSQITLTWQLPYIKPPKTDTSKGTHRRTESLLSGSDTSSGYRENRTSSSSFNSDSPFFTLSHFTTMNNDQSLSMQVNSILLHWEIGKNPETYDWQAAARSVRENEASQSSIGKSHSRRKNRPRRTEQRGHSEDGVSLGSSQVIPAVRESRQDTPGTKTSRAATSQQVDKQQAFKSPKVHHVPPNFAASQIKMPMTQEEPGLFGSRDARKKTGQGRIRKKRAAGF